MRVSQEESPSFRAGRMSSPDALSRALDDAGEAAQASSALLAAAGD